MTGFVSEVTVDMGQYVEAGDVLLQTFDSGNGAAANHCGGPRHTFTGGGEGRIGRRAACERQCGFCESETGNGQIGTCGR